MAPKGFESQGGFDLEGEVQPSVEDQISSLESSRQNYLPPGHPEPPGLVSGPRLGKPEEIKTEIIVPTNLLDVLTELFNDSLHRDLQKIDSPCLTPRARAIRGQRFHRVNQKGAKLSPTGTFPWCFIS